MLAIIKERNVGMIRSLWSKSFTIPIVQHVLCGPGVGIKFHSPLCQNTKCHFMPQLMLDKCLTPLTLHPLAVKVLTVHATLCRADPKPEMLQISRDPREAVRRVIVQESMEGDRGEWWQWARDTSVCHLQRGKHHVYLGV